MLVPVLLSCQQSGVLPPPVLVASVPLASRFPLRLAALEIVSACPAVVDVFPAEGPAIFDAFPDEGSRDAQVADGSVVTDGSGDGGLRDAQIFPSEGPPPPR